MFAAVELLLRLRAIASVGSLRNNLENAAGIWMNLS
jgi:hypothetical protein